jgi:hypothetical protein
MIPPRRASRGRIKYVWADTLARVFLSFILKRGSLSKSDQYDSGPPFDVVEDARLAPKEFNSQKSLDLAPGGGGLGPGQLWHETKRWLVDKYYDKNFKFMLLLLLFVIGFGTANRVIYKIQLHVPYLFQILAG